MTDKLTTLMGVLADFTAHTSEEEFFDIFGPVDGPHLWELWQDQEVDENAIKFWAAMSWANREEFVDYLSIAFDL